MAAVDVVRKLGLVVTAGLFAGACVVTPYEGVSEAPNAPLPPTARARKEAAENAPEAPESVVASHLLVQYKGARAAGATITRSRDEARARAAEALAAAKGGAEFVVLVTTYSDEPGAAERGGSLGRFRAEEMVPQFSDAAFALPVGGVSELVETPFGFHVIKRTE